MSCNTIELDKYTSQVKYLFEFVLKVLWYKISTKLQMVLSYKLAKVLELQEDMQFVFWCYLVLSYQENSFPAWWKVILLCKSTHCHLWAR